MKFIAFIGLLLFVASCGMKVPYTDKVKEQYNLSEENLKKVQFFTSATIILQRKNSMENQGTTDNGTLVSNESSVENRLIIPVNTKCIYESIEANGDINVRFELGQNKYLRFAIRKGQTNGRYYLLANSWDANKGGEINYGNLTYYATTDSGSAYLQVVIKKLKKIKRKDRVVKGLKV
ncbi:MAG: hypothetical protein ACK5B9_01400 [Flavobacteriia bacterium]|jgi:hypothetical protein